VRKSLLFLTLLLLLTKYADAQQDPQFSQYMFNQLYFNPAFAGVEGVTKFTAVHRSQWLGYSPTIGAGGAPTTQMITFNTPLFKMNSGVGAYIVNDRLGPQTNLEAQVSYAYHLAVKDGKLSIGLRTGMYSQTIDWSMYRALDPNDPLLKDGAPTSQQRLDLAAGMYYRKEKFYAGVSFNHLTHANFDFDIGQRSALQTHMYFTGGYYYDVSFDLRFQFMTLVKTDFTKTSFDLGGIAYIKDTMWGGLSFRQSEAAILLLGYSFLKDKSLKLGYALDYIVKDQAAKQPTSHEFMLSYELPVTPIGKKVVRTPRYRH
jgi:type IX secretion system PorP/SprF family membrane protein